MTTKISILTPTVRPEGLAMVSQCLEQQTHQDWEWLVSMPESLVKNLSPKNSRIHLFTDPPKRPGDFYALNKAWNNLVYYAKHELLVFLVDWTWFGPETLATLVATYEEDPQTGVSALVNHFRVKPDVGYGRPEVLWRYDPRPGEMDLRGATDNLIPPEMMEFALASIPRAGYVAVGGLDEQYDQVAGNSEKELCLRLALHGYRFFLDRRLEARSWTHPKSMSSASWNEHYAKAQVLAYRHRDEMAAGTRRTVPNPIFLEHGPYGVWLEAYMNAHAACPQCYSTDYETTSAGVQPPRDHNAITCCVCGWRGVGHDLVPKAPLTAAV